MHGEGLAIDGPGRMLLMLLLYLRIHPTTYHIRVEYRVSIACWLRLESLIRKPICRALFFLDLGNDHWRSSVGWFRDLPRRSSDAGRTLPPGTRGPRQDRRFGQKGILANVADGLEAKPDTWKPRSSRIAG